MDVQATNPKVIIPIVTCSLVFSFLIGFFPCNTTTFPKYFCCSLVFWVGHRNNYNACLWHQTCAGAKDLLNHIQMHTCMTQSNRLVRTKQKAIQNFCGLLSVRYYISARFSTIRVKIKFMYVELRSTSVTLANLYYIFGLLSNYRIAEI